MDKREEFMVMNQRFFDAGFVKEIYGNENLSIMNVCNSLYVVTQYYKNRSGNYSAYMFSSEIVKNIVEDNDYFHLLINYADRKQLENNAIEFNDILYEQMKKIKMQTDLEGPTKYIDFEMEEQLMNKNKGKNF